MPVPGQPTPRQYRPKPKKRRSSGGHPSQGAPTAGGGTGGNPIEVYRSPTPSVPQQRREAAAPAPTETKGRGGTRGTPKARRSAKLQRQQRAYTRRKRRARRDKAAGVAWARTLAGRGESGLQDSMDINLQRGVAGFRENRDRAAAEVPSIKRKIDKARAAPRKSPTESEAFPGLARQARKAGGDARKWSDRPKDTPAAKAFRENARPAVVKGFREERAKQPALVRGVKHREQSVENAKRRAAEQGRKAEAEFAKITKKQQTAGTPEQKDALAKQLKNLRQSGTLPEATGIGGGLKKGVLGVMDELQRPVHASAEGTRRFLKSGGNYAEAAEGAYEGITNKKKTYYSDVLKEYGVPNGAAAVGGFIADVGLDPTTWVTGGTAIPAKVAARKAGQQAAKEAGEAATKRLAAATRRGQVSPKQLNRIVGKEKAKAYAKAEKRAIDTVDDDYGGLTIGVGNLRTSGKSTAGLNRTVAGVVNSNKVTRAAGAFVRDTAHQVSPHIRPAGVSRRQHEGTKGGAREARARQTQGRVNAVATGYALKDHIPAEHWENVVDHIERGTLHQLEKAARASGDEGLTKAASGGRVIERLFREQMKRERAAGLDVGDEKNYFSHQLAEGMETETHGKVTASGMAAGFKQGRKHEGTVAELREQGIDFSTDIPKVVAQRLAHGETAAARADFAKSAVESGRNIRHLEAGAPPRQPNEAYFYYQDGSAKMVSSLPEAQRIERKLKIDVFIADKAFLNEQMGSVGGVMAATKFGRGYDKFQGAWKFQATQVNPGFHIRNYIGDTHNAWLGQNMFELAKNIGTARRVLSEVNRQEKDAFYLFGNRSDASVLKGEKTIDLPNTYGEMEPHTIFDIAQEQINAGSIRAGQIQGEVAEQLQTSAKLSGRTGRAIKGASGTSRRRRAGRNVRRALHNREDMMRLATAMHARKKGATPRGAAAMVNRQHFDYGDLSSIERKGFRRVIPFYTFTARNIPLQMKSIALNPGKYANYEKLRNEVGLYFDIPDMDRFDEGLKKFQEKGLPMPIEIDGMMMAVSPSLPSSDLHMVPWGFLGHPSGVAAVDWADEVGKRWASMLQPMIRNPVEIWANKSFFFGEDLEDPHSPLVPAPDWAGWMPKSWQSKLGVGQIEDRRTGKTVLGWSAFTAAAASIVPGPAGFYNRVTTEGTSRKAGREPWHQALSWAGGVKLDPWDKRESDLEVMFEELDDLEKRAGKFGQQPSKKKSGAAERAGKAVGKKQQQIKELTEKMSFSDPYFSGSAPKTPEEKMEDKIKKFQEKAAGADLDEKVNKFMGK